MGSSRYLILNIVNIFRLESTRRGESTNFEHQNSIENNVYLGDFCRYHQIFSSSTTTLEILQENININIENINSRSELVPSPRANARNGAPRRWLGDYNIVPKPTARSAVRGY